VLILLIVAWWTVPRLSVARWSVTNSKVALIAQCAQVTVAALTSYLPSKWILSSKSERDRAACAKRVKNSAKSPSRFCLVMYSWPKRVTLFWSTLTFFPFFDVAVCWTFVKSDREFLLIGSWRVAIYALQAHSWRNFQREVHLHDTVLMWPRLYHFDVGGRNYWLTNNNPNMTL